MLQPRVVMRYAVTAITVVVLCLLMSAAVMMRPTSKLLSSGGGATHNEVLNNVTTTVLLYRSDFVDMVEPLLTTNARERQQEEQQPPATNVRDSNEHFTWSGGGVLGRSEAMTNVLLEEWHMKIRSVLLAGEIDRLNKQDQAALLIIAHQFLHNATVIVLDNADCLYAMKPADVLQCHAWAAAASTAQNHLGSSGATTRLFNNNTLASMCAHTMACGVWGRGRYNTRLNATFLDDIFKRLVANTVAVSQRAPLVRNVVHRGESGPEHRWFAERIELAGYRKRRHVTWLAEWSLTNQLKVNVPLDVRPFHQGGAMWVNLTTNSTPRFVLEQQRLMASGGIL